LAREILTLRPSQLSELSTSLTGAASITALFRAIEIAFEKLDGVDSETVERLYLFGLEIRQVLENSREVAFSEEEIEALARHNTAWPNVWSIARVAFLAGLVRWSLGDLQIYCKENNEGEQFGILSQRRSIGFDQVPDEAKEEALVPVISDRLKIYE